MIEKYFSFLSVLPRQFIFFIHKIEVENRSNYQNLICSAEITVSNLT